MELEVKRDADQPNHCTFGKLSVDGVASYETLEDVVREVEGATVANWKVAGDTAIPRGRYRIVVNHSNRFKRELPQLLNVPGFEGIRIHAGNTEADTEGCILVGTTRAGAAVQNSRVAFNELFDDIKEALANGEQVWITVT